MTEERIARLNELARKSKTIGLTEEEKQEQATLRLEYLASIRQSLEAQLDNTLIQEFLQQLLYARALYTQQFSNICILRRNMICKICDNLILLPCGFYRHFFIVTFYRRFFIVTFLEC